MRRVFSFVSFPQKEGNPSFYRYQHLESLFFAANYSTTIEPLFCNFSKPGSCKLFWHLNYLVSVFRLYSSTKASVKKTKFDSTDIIFLHTLDIFSMLYLRRIGKRKHVIVVYDCVEWPSPSEKRFGVFSASYIKRTFINRFWINKSVRVISISSYLNDYFLCKGIRSVRIPNLSSSSVSYQPFLGDTACLSFLFAGYPRKKDLLSVFLDAVCELPDNKRGIIHVYVAGPSADFYQTPLGCAKYVSSHFHFLGFQGRDAVIDLYSKCNFSILIRNQNLRVCKAGFPTKFVESLLFSTPVFCNISSDLGMYVNNEVNSFVVSDCSVNSIKKGLLNLVELFSLSPETIMSMRKQAYLSSQAFFLPDYFVSSFLSLLNE